MTCKQRKKKKKTFPPFFSYILSVDMPPFHEEHIQYKYQTELNRTQHKLQLQRQSFLANDKDYLNHPKNMKRLTKELDRINKEYKCLRQYHDPLSESFKRLSYSQKASFTKKHAHPSIQRILEKK